MRLRKVIGSPMKSITVTHVLELGKKDKFVSPEKALSDVTMSQKENKEPPSWVKWKIYIIRSKVALMGGEEVASKGGLAQVSMPKVILGRKSQISEAKILDELEVKDGK